MCELSKGSKRQIQYHEDPKGPPVCTLVVPSPVYHFWSHVLYSTTERIGLLLLVYWFLAESKVYNNSITRIQPVKNGREKKEINRWQFQMQAFERGLGWLFSEIWLARLSMKKWDCRCLETAHCFYYNLQNHSTSH